MQVDGVAGQHFDRDYRGLGIHFFLRNKDTGTVAIYADGVAVEGGDIVQTQIGAEGELYLGNAFLDGFIGQNRFDDGVGTETNTVYEGSAGFYATPNTRLHAGGRRVGDWSSYFVGVEQLFDTGPTSPSVFAEAEFGDDFTTVRGGVRLFINTAGRNGSLQDRYEEDDPPVRVTRSAHWAAMPHGAGAP